MGGHATADEIDSTIVKRPRVQESGHINCVNEACPNAVEVKHLRQQIEHWQDKFDDMLARLDKLQADNLRLRYGQCTRDAIERAASEEQEIEAEIGLNEKPFQAVDPIAVEVEPFDLAEEVRIEEAVEPRPAHSVLSTKVTTSQANKADMVTREYREEVKN